MYPRYSDKALRSGFFSEPVRGAFKICLVKVKGRNNECDGREMLYNVTGRVSNGVLLASTPAAVAAVRAHRRRYPLVQSTIWHIHSAVFLDSI